MDSTPSPSIPKPPPDGYATWLDQALRERGYWTASKDAIGNEYRVSGEDYEYALARAELQAIRSRLAEAERERDDARLMLRFLIVPNRDRWLDHKIFEWPDGRWCISQVVDEPGTPVVSVKVPDDGTGLPLLDDAARAALGRAK